MDEEEQIKLQLVKAVAWRSHASSQPSVAFQPAKAIARRNQLAFMLADNEARLERVRAREYELRCKLRQMRILIAKEKLKSYRQRNRLRRFRYGKPRRRVKKVGSRSN